MKNVDKYPLVWVIWNDIVATDATWRDADDAIHWVDTECGLVHQVGFQLEKNDEYVVLIDSFFEEGTTVGTVTRIPIATVKEIKIIKP